MRCETGDLAGGGGVFVFGGGDGGW